MDTFRIVYFDDTIRTGVFLPREFTTMGTEPSFGYIEWSEATLDRVFKERDDNDHPPVDQTTIDGWRELSPLSARACGQMMDLLSR